MEHNINSGDSTDLYGAPHYPMCTPHTSASTFWWTGEESGLHITNISAPGSTMTFDFRVVDITWVDFEYTGMFELGTFDLPFDTLSEGVTATASGDDLFIKAGTMYDTITLDKPMTIDNWGGDVFLGITGP
jgi:hypothetical protein